MPKQKEVQATISIPPLSINEILQELNIEPEWPSGSEAELKAFENNLQVAIALFVEVVHILSKVAKEHPEYAGSVLRKCLGTIEALIEEAQSRSGELSVTEEYRSTSPTLEEQLTDSIVVLSGARAELQSGIAISIFNLISHLESMKQTAVQELQQP